jgi:hypothetical protein
LNDVPLTAPESILEMNWADAEKVKNRSGRSRRMGGWIWILFDILVEGVDMRVQFPMEYSQFCRE